MKGKNTTPEEFKMAKALLASGMQAKEVANLMKLAMTTVLDMKKAGDWEEYKTVRTERANGNVIQKSGSSSDMRIIELLKENNEIMKGISNKLAFIVEELTGKEG